jgi:hypothetical protein
MIAMAKHESGAAMPGGVGEQREVVTERSRSVMTVRAYIRRSVRLPGRSAGVRSRTRTVVLGCLGRPGQAVVTKKQFLSLA